MFNNDPYKYILFRYSVRTVCRVAFRGCMLIPGCKPFCYKCFLPMCYSCTDSDDDVDKDDDDDDIDTNTVELRTSQHGQVDTNHNPVPLDLSSRDQYLPIQNDYYNDVIQIQSTSSHFYRDQKHVYVNDESDATYRDSNFRNSNFISQFENVTYGLCESELNSPTDDEPFKLGDVEQSPRYIKEQLLYKQESQPIDVKSHTILEKDKSRTLVLLETDL